MTVSTACPSVLALRRTIERHILDIYVDDSLTLKPKSEWPGFYTLPNKTTIPAIYVVGASMVPSNWSITGIECTIDDVPEDITSPGSLGGVISYERWPVRFTNYGTRNGTQMPVSMLAIRRRLAYAFPMDRTTYMRRTEVTYESLTISILGPTLNPSIP